MIVGIDVDGILVDTDYFGNVQGTKEYGCPPPNPEGYYIKDKWGLSEQEDQRFWDKYRVQYVRDYTPIDGIELFAQYLNAQNIEHYIITNRGCDAASPGEKAYIRDKTNELVYKYFPNVSEVIYNEAGSKLGYCRSRNIDVMIEDAPHHLEELCQYMYCICLDYRYNRFISDPKLIHVTSLAHIPAVLDILRRIFDGRGNK